MNWQATKIIGAGALIGTLFGCGEDEQPKFTLKEVIEVQGTCAEDRVGRQDHYAGQVVRWQSVQNGTISTYGFISKPFSTEAILEEAKHPTAYTTPSMISFMAIDIDTSEPMWLLHGVSDRGEDQTGYVSARSDETRHGNSRYIDLANEAIQANRIGRRTIICIMRIVALAVIWNVVAH